MASFNYRKTSFLLSAAKYLQFPQNIQKEVAFVGISNTGKSSALNALTDCKKLAKTSKTPGRTQLINFFEIQPGFCLVDLPGFGYAKVPENIKSAWTKTVNEYLQWRQSLTGIILLMDIRNPMKPFEINFLKWSSKNTLPIHILLTKADKYKPGLAKQTLLQITQQLPQFSDRISIQLFSATKKIGNETLIQTLNTWFSST